MKPCIALLAILFGVVFVWPLVVTAGGSDPSRPAISRQYKIVTAHEMFGLEDGENAAAYILDLEKTKILQETSLRNLNAYGAEGGE